MVNTLEFDSNAPGSTPGPAANMGSYTVVSSGAGCKLAAFGLGWCDSITPHHFCRSNSIGGMLPCQGKCRGSTPVSCSNACIAQLVEHTLGTGEVMRSSRIASSIWAGSSEVEWRTENSFVGGLIPPWPTI